MRQSLDGHTILQTGAAWRWLVAGSFLVAVARGMGPAASADRLLTALQFGLLAITLALLTVIRPKRCVGEWRLPHILALSFGSLALLSSVWSLVPRVTLSRALLLAILLLLTVQTARIRWSNHPKVRAEDMRLGFWLIVLFAGFGLTLAVFGVPEMWGAYNRFKGFTANATVIAWIATIAFPLGYARALVETGRRRAAYLIGCAVLGITVVASGTRGATMGLIGAMILVHILVRKSWIVGAFFACTLAILSFVGLSGLAVQQSATAPKDTPTASAPANEAPSTPEPSLEPSAPSGIGRVDEPDADISSGRFDLWQSGIDMWSERPVAGWGYGSTDHLKPFENANGMSLHNAYLSSLVELGLVGFGIFVTFILGLLARRDLSLQPGIAAAAFAVVANGFFESSLLGLGSPITILSWIVLGALLSVSKGPRGDNTRDECSALEKFGV